MKKIRIFISSPSDVQIEREIARNVINELNSIYENYIKLEVVMWEDFPLSSIVTFQEGINHFITNEPIDIAVFILWSRLGTPLSVKFQKEDGSIYQSGTEYEFDLMMKLHNEHNQPSRILTYVKQNDDYPKNLNWEELRETIRQKECLDSFLKEYFRDEETNSNYAYRQFGKNISFEQMFRTHITNTIKDIIGEIEELKEWNGNPYVGLNSFEYDQQTIFFGRRQLVYETASKLAIFEGNSNCKNSLIVLGESGSGKSSFVKAGLLPFFCNKNNSDCRYVTIQPSMYRGQMYSGLLELLVEKFEFLDKHPFIEELQKGITSETNFKYLHHELEKQSKGSLIIYIDQFEELFSDSQITEEERKSVLLLLRGLVGMRNIILFISMRSDFYNRFSKYEELSQIKEKCEVIDLPVMGIMEIAEIVKEPARKAGLKWEIDEKGASLSKRVVKEAVSIKNLPLIEFALSELYAARDLNDILTKKAYEQIGGIKGAIVNYANRCYSQLTDDEKNTFNDILGFVVTESSSHKGTYVRKTSLREDAEKTSIHKSVIERMLNARLFVSGKDSHGKPTITITHEILLSSWGIVAQWIEKEKTFITDNNHYEQIAQHWLNNGKKKKDLVRGRSSLLEAEYYHFKNHKKISDNVLEFLRQSFKKEKWKGVVWRGLIFILVNILFFVLNEDTAGIDDKLCLVLSYIAALSMTGCSFILHIIGAPEYKTQKWKVLVCTLATFLLLAVALIIAEEAFYYLILIPVIIYLLNETWEYIRRITWKKKFVPYVISDEIWGNIKTMSYAPVICLFILGYTTENEDRLERRADVADALFEGLNNMSNNLSYTDWTYLNEMRKKYLEDNFSDEINDGIADNRDLEYARSLYNLNKPQEAIIHTSKDKRWDHHLFSILCSYAYGDYDRTRVSLIEYALGERFDKIDNNTSTANLIWIAEVLGEFEIAESLDSIVCDTLADSENEIGSLINRGHIHLYKGDIEQSLTEYHKAISLCRAYGYMDINGNEIALNNLKNDLHIFSRFKVIPDSALQRMADKMNIEFKPAYISQTDNSTGKYNIKDIAGNWECNNNDTIIRLNVDALHNIFTYKVYDKNDIELWSSICEVRFGTPDDPTYIDSYTYIDEFNTSTNQNFFSRILEIEDNDSGFNQYFVLEIIENGIPDDTGKQRVYRRYNGFNNR